MGGYAAYVWPVFGVAFLLVVGIALTPRFRHLQVIKEIRNEREVHDED